MLWYTSLLLAFLAISVVSTTRKIGHPTIFSLSFLTRRRRETPTANLFFDFQDGKADEDQSVTTNAAASLVAESTKGLRGLGGPPGAGTGRRRAKGSKGSKKSKSQGATCTPNGTTRPNDNIPIGGDCANCCGCDEVCEYTGGKQRCSTTQVYCYCSCPQGPPN